MRLPVRAFAGNAAYEYAVPLLVFVLLAGAITYHAHLPDVITRHFGLPPDSRPLAERISVDAYSSLEVHDPDPLDDVPGTPQVVHHPLGDVRLLLNNGDTVLLENVPMNVPELAAKEGVGAVTRRYADSLDRLVVILEESDQLQSPGTDFLREVARQGRTIAETEAAVEDWMGEGESVVPTGIQELGFAEKAPNTTPAALKKLSPNKQSRILINLLETAREQKALKDRAVEAFVTEIVSRILLTSDALENIVADGGTGKQGLKERLLRELHRLNPCEQKVPESHRLFCPRT